MHELRAVVTRKGQVTIPAEVRKALDIKRGDVVTFTVPESPATGSTVRRAPADRTSVVKELFGSLRSDVPMLTPEQEKAAFAEAFAREADSHPPGPAAPSDHA